MAAVTTTLGARRWCPTLAEVRWMAPAEVKDTWSKALRSAASATWPLQTVELRHAAYLARYLVEAERIAQERAREHLRTAAQRSGLQRTEAERVIADAWNRAGAALAAEVNAGGTSRSGAFRAVAAATERYDRENQFFVSPQSLHPLPAGVLVHLDHPPAGLKPVGVAVPRSVDGVIEVDAVLASQAWGSPAGDAWTLVRKGRIRAVSILAGTQEFHRGVHGRLTWGVLVSVDLVRSPADKAATISEVIEADKMTPGQRRTQRLLDAYLADPASPRGHNLIAAAEARGVAALDVLAEVVAPLRTEMSG